ncbi:MAG: L-2-amino-thiazoline-4-carboxylic acid hydrolase [Candidatus Adiutrix sp.]|nr:L-2-amino-thiazoline-4-carboxylic acid hydrolase [Candidatus Adiutrix sp.]
MKPQLDLAERLSKVSPLDRRAIEIEMAEMFTAAVADRYGPEAAGEILRTVVRRAAGRAAAAIRRRQPKPTLLDILEVWRDLGGDGRLEMDLEEFTPRALRFRVKRCAYAEAYRALNLEGLGVKFSCHRDEHFAQALIPGLRLKQSPTIMEGYDHCCFEYFYDDADGEI